VTKSINNIQHAIAEASKLSGKKKKEAVLSPEQKLIYIEQLKTEMFKAAEELDFEKAIALREQIQKLS
jgi:excinuclease UvrABC helicase subunit UvrB